MITNRILQLIEYKGINKNKFYIKTGLSNGFLDKVKDIGASKIEQILNSYPDINPEWLLTGKGDMLKQNIYLENTPTLDTTTLNEPHTKMLKLKVDKLEPKQSVPLYDAQATTGIISLFTDSNIQEPIGYLSIPNLPKCDGAIYVNGNSMYPLLKSGDIIIYKQMNPVADNIFWGEMYLISLTNDNLDEFIMLKWIQKSEKGDEWIKLVSENKHHQPKDIHLKNIKVLALIKASIKIILMY
jgi:phage repressor protein C with HTH and peptisase S24 domain